MCILGADYELRPIDWTLLLAIISNPIRLSASSLESLSCASHRVVFKSLSRFHLQFTLLKLLSKSLKKILFSCYFISVFVLEFALWLQLRIDIKLKIIIAVLKINFLYRSPKILRREPYLMLNFQKNFEIFCYSRSLLNLA